MRKRIVSAFLILIMTLSCAAATVPLAHATYYDGWKNKVILTIDSTKIGSPLVDFPIYLEISNSSGITDADITDIFDEIGSNHNKMMVTTEAFVPLYCEVVSWDEIGLYAELWVKIPLIDNMYNTIIYLFYGATHASNTAYMGLTGSNNAEKVWVNGYVMVQHMNDKTTSSIEDSTSYDNDGTKKGANEPIEAFGKIGKAQDEDGVDDYINFGHDSSFDLTTNGMIELWVVSDRAFPSDDATSYYRGLVAKSVSGGIAHVAYSLDWNGNNASRYLRLLISDGVNLDNCGVTWAPTVGQKYHIVAKWDGSDVYLLVDNVQIRTIPQTRNAQVTIHDVKSSATFGVGASQNWDGKKDEIRIQTVRSSAWVGASYQTQTDNLLYVGEPIPEPVVSNPLTLFALLGFIFGICAIALVMANKKK